MPGHLVDLQRPSPEMEVMREPHGDRLKSLMYLYNAESILAFFAVCANCVLLSTFRKFSVFHDHLRAICAHLTVSIVITALFCLFRALVGVYQLAQLRPASAEPPVGAESESTQPSQAKECAFAENIPFCLCAQLCALSIILSIERFYATLNYVKYELQSIVKALRIILLLLWLPFVPSIVLSFFSLNSRHLLIDCVRSRASVGLLARNAGLLVAVLCEFIFALIFVLLRVMNNQRQAEYIKHYYRSLSSRFQIGENLRTAGIMALLHGLNFAAFLGLLAADHYALGGGAPRHDFWMELPHLLLPVYTLAFPLIFAGSDALLRRKYGCLLRALLAPASTKGAPFSEKSLVDEA